MGWCMYLCADRDYQLSSCMEPPTPDGRYDPKEGWVFEYDHKTGHFYHFNTQTGESQWAEEATQAEEAVLLGDDTTPKALNCGKALVRGNEEAPRKESPVVVDEHTPRTGPTPFGDDEDMGLEGDSTIMLETSRQSNEVHQRTQPVVMAFTAMFMFHGCCCEGPMAVIEGAIRAPGYIAGAVFVLLWGALTQERACLYDAGLWLREGILMLFAVLTLMIPCLSLCVYRQFDAEADEWQLSAIPTLVGKVDPRRFYTFSHGQGSMASNAFYDADTGSLDTFGNRILHPPKSLLMVRHLDSSDNGSSGSEDGGVRGLEMKVQLSEQNKAYHQIEGGSRRL